MKTSILSEKYIAGFLDADGCIGIHWRSGKYNPQIYLEFSQKTSQDKVIELIHQVTGGCLNYKIVNDVSYTRLNIRAKQAEKILNRIRKYLVLKKRYAGYCLDLVAKGRPLNLDDVKKSMKEQRKVKSLPLPNYPSRKWLAGYFDGDGCLYAVINKKHVANIHFSIASSWFDSEGIEIIQKAFGGTIRIMNQGNRVHQLINSLSPSKAKKFLRYFSKYLIVKKSQAQFILGCAEMGHYRDGRSINSALKQLKAHQHRLSEPEVDLKSFLDSIQDKKWGRHGYGVDQCQGCGKDDIPHYAKGLCTECYATRYNEKRRLNRLTYATVGAV